MNKALLAQLGLAKEAGTKAMAKDFFAKPPGPAAEAPDGSEAMQMSAPGNLGEMKHGEGDEMPPSADELTPEQLEELLQLLGAQGGAE